MSGGYVTGRCEVCGSASPYTPVCGECETAEKSFARGEAAGRAAERAAIVAEIRKRMSRLTSYTYGLFGPSLLVPRGAHMTTLDRIAELLMAALTRPPPSTPAPPPQPKRRRRPR